MRILIDIPHPAHVHFFKHFRTEMIERGHEVLVTARDKDVAVDLLQELDIPHEVLSTQGSGVMGMAGELAVRCARLIRVARRFKPTLLTGIMGAAIAPVGRVLRVPSVVFYDSEFAQRTNRVVYPLAGYVCTPDSYTGSVRGNHVTYAGYHELAYLHPRRFTPDAQRLAAFNLTPPYSVVRLVSWEASHDAGQTSIDLPNTIALVRRLQDHTPVVVSSEGRVPAELEPLRLQGPVRDIHHILAHADLLVGDSGTMVSEAVVLGTPAVLVSPMRAGVHDDQAGYGLLTRTAPQALDEALRAARSFLESGPPAGAHERLLADKIDVTEWMVGFFQQRESERRV